MQPIRVTIGHTTRARNKEPLQPFQMNIYQINTYRKESSQLHFDYEQMVQETQHVKNQQSYISVSVVYLTHPSSSQDHQPTHGTIIPNNAIWQIYRDKEQLRKKKLLSIKLQLSQRQFQQQIQCKSPNPISSKK